MSTPASPARTPARGGVGAGGTPGRAAQQNGGGADMGMGVASAEPGARLERLEVFNFKSYEGHHSVPFKKFTAGQSIERQQSESVERAEQSSLLTPSRISCQ
jgi:hypothetical protein